MRLPWPFRRPPPPTPAASSGSGVQEPVLPAGRAEWRKLPPLESSLREAPLMAPPRRFNAGLAGSHVPPPILEPLGHEVSTDGPQGLVMGTVTPSLAGPGVAHGATAANGPATSLDLRRPARATVQRAVEAFEEPAAQPDALPSAGALPPVQRAVAPAAPVAGPLPVRRSLIDASFVPHASVEPGAGPTLHPPATSHDLAPGSAADHPIPAREPLTGGAADVPKRTMERSLAGVRRVRLGPPIAPPTPTPPATASPTSSPAAPLVQRAGQSVVPDARRPAHSESRPLQQPIVLRPRVRRGAERAAEPVMRDDLSVPLTLAPPPWQASAPSATAASGLEAGRAARPAEPLGAAPSASGPNGLPPADRGDATRALSTPVVARLPAAADQAPRNVAPLASGRALRAAGANPSRGTAHATEQPVTQRTATSPGPTRAGPAASLPGGATSAPVPVHRGETATRLAGAGLRAATIDGAVHVPPTAGALDAGAGRALLAHESTHVLQQRRLGAAMPPAGSESRHQLEREAREAEAWSLWTDLALPPTTHPTGSAAVGTIASSVGHGATDGVSVPTTRPSSLDAQTAPRLGSTASRGNAINIQGAEGDAPPASAPAGAAEQAAMSDRDVETLLRRLYPRLRHYLADELLVARERAGRLADLG